jgi:CubicO group peptidase (beta-lactamase class C family)
MISELSMDIQMPDMPLPERIIEKVSGLKWEDYLKEKIFLPLKMNRTTALSTDYAIAENIAMPHTIS